MDMYVRMSPHSLTVYLYAVAILCELYYFNLSALLVDMLSKEESFFTSELSTGKAQREMTRLRAKAK